MNKTPVSLLQELMMRQGYVPKYQEICSQTGTQQCMFTIRVSCMDLTADGTASNKKEAKHNAAREMLVLLQSRNVISNIDIPSARRSSSLEPSSPRVSSTSLCTCHSPVSLTQPSSPGMQSPLHVPQSSSPAAHLPKFVNYVGKLQEYCTIKKLPLPVYVDINEQGPSHMKVFTISCTVSSLQGEGTGTTKKEAKQEAAKKIWERLTQNDPLSQQSLDTTEYDGDVKRALEEIGIEIAKLEIKNEECAEKAEKAKLYYQSIKKRSIVPKQPVEVGMYHESFKAVYGERISEVQKRYLINLKNDVLVHHTDEIISYIQLVFKVSVQEVNLHTKSHVRMIGLRISHIPEIFVIGIGLTREKAMHEALCNLLCTILTLLN